MGMKVSSVENGNGNGNCFTEMGIEDKFM